VVLYLDGREIGSKLASDNGRGGADHDRPPRHGLRAYWFLKSQWPDRQHFRGCLDEVCVYKRQLTAEEIARLAAGEKPPGSR